MSVPLSHTRLTSAEVRLAQYGEQATWSNATYGSGTEKALHETATGLKEEIDRLRAELEERRVELRDRRTEDLNLRGLLAPNGLPRRVPMQLGASLAPAVEWLLAELAAEQSKVRAVETVKCWTNEDGRRFVFADDLAFALGYTPSAAPTA